MPHTDDEIKAAEARLERRLEAGDTFEVHDISELRAVADAAKAAEAAQALLRERVQIARGRGHSWNRIAIPLGVSRQAARQRFGTRSEEDASGNEQYTDLMAALEAALETLRRGDAELHQHIEERELSERLAK